MDHPNPVSPVSPRGGGGWSTGDSDFDPPISLMGKPNSKRNRLRRRFRAFTSQYSNHWVIDWLPLIALAIAAAATSIIVMKTGIAASGWALGLAAVAVLLQAEVLMTICSVALALGWVRLSGYGRTTDLVGSLEMMSPQRERVENRKKNADGKGLRKSVGQWRPPQVIRWDFLATITSRAFGKIASFPLPRPMRAPIFTMYGRVCGVNFEEMEYPPDYYRSLRAFFTRSLKPGLRHINETTALVSPVDAKVVVLGEVTSDEVEQVKGVTYSMSQFLGEHSTANLGPNTRPRRELEVSLEAVQARSGGKNTLFYLVAYLNPGDYHRIHSPVDMEVERLRHFPGTVFPISPLVTRLIPNVFAMNERVVLAGEWKYGAFSYTAVGAYNVGSIAINFEPSIRTNRGMLRNPNVELMSYGGVGCYAYVRRYGEDTENKRIHLDKGEEIGRFNMGSTVVLIFEAPKDFKFDVEAGDKIILGQSLGKC